MTTIERPYLYIKPPDMEEAGRYLLIAARPAFGTTIGTPVMVKLDYIKHFGVGESAWIEGYTELSNGLEKIFEKVIEFPAMCPYLLIPAHRAQLLSAEEAASKDKELSKKIESVLKSQEEKEEGEGEKAIGVYL